MESTNDWFGHCDASTDTCMKIATTADAPASLTSAFKICPKPHNLPFMESQLAGRCWTQQERLACVEAVRYILRTTSNRMTLADLYKRVSEHLARHYSIQRSRSALYAYVRSNLSFLLPEIHAIRQEPALPANDDQKPLRYEQNPTRSALLAPGFSRDEDHLHMLTWSEWELDAFFWPLLSDIDAGWSPAPEV